VALGCAVVLAGTSAALAQGGGAAVPGAPVKSPLLAAGEGERVEQYLERLGLQELLAEHLRARLSDKALTDVRERGRVAERLAKLYAQMLAGTSDGARRAELIAQGSELLRTGLGGRGYGLRLTLLRERYRPSEEQAERWRLGLAGEPERSAAVEELRGVRSQLMAVITEVARREREVTAALDNAAASDPVALDNERRDLQGYRIQADYYAGWCAYYMALMHPSNEGAGEAVLIFARVLRVPSEKTEPEGYRTESFSDEGLARAAVGMALSLGLARKTTPASAWLDALEREPATPAGVRDGLLSWRVSVLAGGGRWSDIDRAVRVSREGKQGQPLTVSGARLLIQLGLSAQVGKDPLVLALTGGLMRVAIEDLVARRELAHVLELVRKVGPQVLGEGGFTKGFVGVYVMGHQALERAQEAHEEGGAKTDEPATQAEVVNAFADAARLLNDASEQEDAGYFAGDVPQALRFSGRALFMAGRLREAAERYALASQAAKKANDAPEAESALWLAVGALDVASRRESNVTELAAIEERLASLSEMYLLDHPAGERAATLALRQLARNDKLDERAVRALQSVTRGSALFEQSRRQLARLLYRQYRAAGASDKAFAASRFLRAADEALGIDQRAAATAGPEQSAALERAVTVARQMLDALLGMPGPDADRAEAVLNAVEQMVAQVDAQKGAGGSRLDMVQIGDELRLRRVQVLLARGRVADAALLVERWRTELEGRTGAGGVTAGMTGGGGNSASSGRTYVAARTAIFREVERRWREAPQGPERVVQARAVMVQGLALLAQTAPSDQSYAQGATASLAARTAAACAELWRGEGDAPARDAALRLDGLILKGRSGVAESLRRVAELSEGAGDNARALLAWRELATGLASGLSNGRAEGDAEHAGGGLSGGPGEAWFEAQYHVIRLLAMVDRAGAAVAASQHVVMNPRGVEPWHSKIVQLARELGPPSGGGGTKDGPVR